MPFSSDELEVGYELPAHRFPTSTVDLFAYSAVTWNLHPLHFDQDYARGRGYSNVLVHSHLLGAYLLRYVTDWAGGPDRVRTMSLRVRQPACAGEVIVCRGTVSSVTRDDPAAILVRLEVEGRRESDGGLCAPATATVALPVAATGR